MLRVFLVVGIPREDGPPAGIDVGDDVRVIEFSRRPEDPLVVGEEAQGSIGGAGVGQREP